LTVLPKEGWAQIVVFASALELLAPQKEGRIPGDVQPDTPLFKKAEGRTPEEVRPSQGAV
jgi:hypothetical protein